MDGWMDGCNQTMALAVSCLTEILDCLPNNLFVITTTLSEIISTEIRPLGDSVLIQTLFRYEKKKFESNKIKLNHEY